MVVSRKILEKLYRKVDKLSYLMEKARIADYLEMKENPARLFVSNFVWGLARGLGMAVGFTILGAIVLYILRAVVAWNLPVIGEFIAEIVKIVQFYTER